eukprot:723405-Amphidinium_carterae.4
MHLGWHELVEQSNKKSEPLTSNLNKAREAKAAGTFLENEGKSVKQNTTYALDIERTLTIISEKEMRRLSGQARIKRGLLKPLNTLEVPSEDASGQMETVYCFADKQNPFRRATLRITSESTLCRSILAPGKALYCGQGEAWHRMASNEQGSAMGTTQLVEKECQGHLNLLDWEDFLEEKLKGGKDDVDEEQEADDALHQDTDLKLVGKAASSVVVAPTGSDFQSPPLMANVDDENLHKTLAQLEKEEIPFTRGLKERILLRQTSRLVAEHRFAEVITCLNPWAAQEFNWQHPTLAGIPDEPGSSKLSTFKSVLFDKVFCKLILEGESKGDTIKALSQQCLSMVESVDLVALDAGAARTLSECETVWKALWALLTPTLDISLQDLELHEGVFSNGDKHLGFRVCSSVFLCCGLHILICCKCKA